MSEEIRNGPDRFLGRCDHHQVNLGSRTATRSWTGPAPSAYVARGVCFDTEFTVPLPVGAAPLVRAWLAARNVRPPVGLVAVVLLSAFCLISLLIGLFDHDLTNEVASSSGPWEVVWGVVLLSVTAVVGLLAALRARQLHRPH
ncbi:hypothetical protein [Geodermatophilus sp. CPCC 206100]|uniref:hypothetical protein n=1 Tax=Geodermatophilus sp. CPCC 206100 TaxID=3020054 RepID=UPI003AFFDF4E